MGSGAKAIYASPGALINSRVSFGLCFFGKLAEIVGEYLKKGSLVFVEGRIQTRSWDKDGETRYTTEIVAEGMKMLPSGGNKPKEDSDAARSAPKGSSKAPPSYDEGPF